MRVRPEGSCFNCFFDFSKRLHSSRKLATYPSYAPSFVFPVAMSEGSHPFPSRTRKLSPPEPMVLRGKPRGRVGRCRILFAEKGPGPRRHGVVRGLRFCGSKPRQLLGF